MTVERSKRRFLIPLVFITKCFKKPLLLRTMKMSKKGLWLRASQEFWRARELRLIKIVRIRKHETIFKNGETIKR